MSCILVLISNKINIISYNSHDQNLMFKSVKRSWDRTTGLDGTYSYVYSFPV